jgi:hypothetical protein
MKKASGKNNLHQSHCTLAYFKRESMNHDTETYLALDTVSTTYAVLLNTEPGKKFAEEYTWASVVVGTGLVLALLRFILPREQ